MLTAEQTQWLEALESGVYKQGRSNLNYDDKYCCLGVGCEIFGIDKVRLTSGTCLYDDQGLRAPKSLVEKLSLYGDIGDPSDGDNEHSLAVLNDTGKTFKQIAATIRENPERYFKPCPAQST